MNHSKTKFIVYIQQAVFFFIINGFYLISFHALWDGRLWYQHMKNQDMTSIFWITNQAKIPLHFHLYGFLATTDYPLFYSKLISFISLLATGLIARWYLEKHQIGDSNGRYWAGIFLCLMPSYLVGTEFAHAQYNLGIFIFFAAMWFHAVMIPHLSRNKWLMFFLNLFVFALGYWCFSVNRGLMFLYPAFLISSFIDFKTIEKTRSFSIWMFEWSKRNWLLILLPPIAWVLRDKPFGIYAGYNQVNFADISSMYEKLKHGLKVGAIGNPMKVFGYGFFDSTLIIFSLIMATLYFFVGRRYLENTSRKIVPNLIFIGFSYLLLLLIIFPYAVVGKAAGFIDYESRHAILFVYPQCLMICLGLAILHTCLDKIKATKIALNILMALALGFTTGGMIHIYRWWDVDWLKREAMTERFKESEAVKAASIIEVFDKADRYDALRRGVEFYDLSQLAEEAFGNQAHLIHDSRFPLSHIVQDPEVRKHYGLKDVDLKGKKIKVDVEYGSLNLFDWEIYLRIKKDQIFNHSKFRNEIKEVIHMRVRPS